MLLKTLLKDNINKINGHLSVLRDTLMTVFLNTLKHNFLKVHCKVKLKVLF